MSRQIELAEYPLRHAPVLEWLRANGLDPKRCLYDQEVVIENGQLTVTEFVFREDGRKLIENYEPVTKQVTVPLISAPENHGL